MKKFLFCCLILAVAVAGFSQAASWWRIPGVGSGPGAHESYWASDVYLFNPGASDIVVELVLSTATGSYGIPTFTVPAYGSTTIPDVCGVFSHQGAGALQLQGRNGAEFYVMSRTYNTEDDGDTQGQDVPGQDWCMGQGPDGLDEGLLFLGIQQTLQFRTNFGFVTDATPVDLVLDVYEDRGLLVVSIPVHLDGSSATQFNLATYTGASVNNGYAIAWMTSTNFACINGYASVADNETNDATTIMGQLIPSATR